MTTEEMLSADFILTRSNKVTDSINTLHTKLGLGRLLYLLEYKIDTSRTFYI